MCPVVKCFGSYSGLARTLFPLCFLLLIVSFVYITYISNALKGPDLCKIWKENIQNSAIERRDEDKQWWEWGCNLEMEWDKGPEYLCRDLRYVANYQICFDEPYTPSPPCLVYSFGIDYDFRFEDKMGRLGCDVYSFDPSMNVQSHNRSEKVRFFNIGIGTSNADSFKPKEDKYTANSKKLWQIKTLPALKKMFGHENRKLDVLKMDIETYEWNVVKDLMDDKSFLQTKQLALEWHIFDHEPARSEFPTMFRTYQRLKLKGWRQFYSTIDSREHSNTYFRSQLNNGLVNTLFAKY